MSHLICVDPDSLDRLWPMVASLIDRAYEATDALMPVDLLLKLRRGDQLLWIATTDDEVLAALTTELIWRRSGLVLLLKAVGGSEIELWKDHLPAIEDYAWSKGCVKVCGEGRGGWARKLTGYRPTTIAFEKLRPEGLPHG